MVKDPAAEQEYLFQNYIITCYYTNTTAKLSPKRALTVVCAIEQRGRHASRDDSAAAVRGCWERMTRCAGCHRKKRPKTFIEMAQTDARKNNKRGPGRVGSRFHEIRVGSRHYQLSSSLLPQGSSSHLHCSPQPSGQLLARLRNPKLSPSDQGRQGKKGKAKHSPMGGVPRSRPASLTPIQVPFPSASHASTPKTAKNHLTQLAMEHSPKTLPIS